MYTTLMQRPFLVRPTATSYHTRPTATAIRPSIRSTNSRFADTNARSASISDDKARRGLLGPGQRTGVIGENGRYIVEATAKLRGLRNVYLRPSR